MERKENIKEYLQKMLDRWNKYDELDGFVAENFRVDLEKTLEYWDLRIADNKQELDKAREEGYQNCMDDIWEKARGLRSWTEHDGSISATDIEAGLQEAYLEIESKLKDNK